MEGKRYEPVWMSSGARSWGSRGGSPCSWSSVLFRRSANLSGDAKYAGKLSWRLLAAVGRTPIGGELQVGSVVLLISISLLSGRGLRPFVAGCTSACTAVEALA